MKILVDADACPVRKIIVNIAKEFNIPVFMVYDKSHIINDGYSENIIVEVDRDSVDNAIRNRAEENDIVVTQDFGLAELCLTKKCNVISQHSVIFNEYNIQIYLNSRDISFKNRYQGKKTSNHKKRKSKDDKNFEKTFRQLCVSLL